MLSGISGSGSFSMMYHYGSAYGYSSRSMRMRRMQTADAVGQGQAAPASERVSQPVKAGVQTRPSYAAKEPAAAVQGQEEAASFGLFIRKGADPAEYAVRMRMQNIDPDSPDFPGKDMTVGKSQSAEKAYDDGKCQTCEERKYQDGSNDMGVSFKTPTRVAPEAAASAVRSHEQEHVSREQAKAKREDRHVVSQSVTLHTSVCPECGRVYVSGGTTRTTTAANQPKPSSTGQGQTERQPFSAVA